jgi:hypothetical protein
MNGIGGDGEERSFVGMEIRSVNASITTQRGGKTQANMVRHVRFILVSVGNGMVALSALLSLATYSSGETSGLQFLCLIPAAGLAGMAALAGCVLVTLSLRRLVVWANLALAVVALVVAAPGQCSGLSNLSGSMLAAALLPLAPILTVAVVRRLGYEDCSL